MSTSFQHLSFHREQSATQSPLLPFLLALGCLAINFVYAPASILMGSMLAALLIWQPNVANLPALLVLQLSKADFLLADYGTFEHSVERFFANSVIIAGFPITSTYAIGAAVAAKVVLEWVARPQRFQQLKLFWYLALWFFLMALTLVMSYQGFLERNPSWTGPFRGAMMAGCLFYGILLRGRGDLHSVVLNWILPMSAVFFGLASIGFFHQQYLWVLSGLAVPVGLYALRFGVGFQKAAAVAAMLLAAIYTLGLAPGIGAVTDRSDMVSGLLGTGSSTFTLNALLALSVGLALVSALGRDQPRASLARVFGLPAIIISLAFSLFVALGSPKYATHRQERVAKTEMKAVERFRAKVFDDRAIIWYGMLSDVRTSDQILRPSGRPVFFTHPVVGDVVWFPGAHNVYFEAFRTYRLIGGGIMIAFLAFLLVRNARVMGTARQGLDRAMAAGLVTVGLIVGVTGHMLISGDAMFWYFVLSGLAVASTAPALVAHGRGGWRHNVSRRRSGARHPAELQA